MKKLILFIVFLILPAVCLASFNVKEWKYYKDIGQHQSGLAKFVLDDELFAGAKDGLADLRIIDNNNQEISYKILVGESKNKSEVFHPKMLNNSFVPGGNSSVILDLERKGVSINRLKINTTSENFQRNVIIYGSDNSNDWKILKDNGYIYDYTDKKGNIKTQNTAVNFPESIYRYLKLEISDPENSPVKITNAEALNYIQEEAKEVQRNPKFSVNQNDDDKTSEIIIDLGAKGIPASKLLLKVSDQNFNRSVLIYRSSDENSWNFTGNDYIFRYNTSKFSGENLEVNFGETSDRHIKVVIQNKDNQALDIAGLVSFYHYREVVFQADGGKNYKVYYGDENAGFPEYDLERFFQYLNLEDSKLVSLSVQKDNSFYAPPQKPFTERNSNFLPFALIAAVLALLFLVFKFFKKGD